MTIKTTGSIFVAQLDTLLGVDALLTHAEFRAVAASHRTRPREPMQTQLLKIAAASDCLVGFAFVLFPAVMLAPVETETYPAGLMVARLAGLSVLALGIACGGAAAELAGTARRWTVVAVSLYNAGAGLCLMFAPANVAQVLLIRTAGVLHVALAAAISTSGFATAWHRLDIPRSAAKRV